MVRQLFLIKQRTHLICCGQCVGHDHPRMLNAMDVLVSPTTHKWLMHVEHSTNNAELEKYNE